MTFEQAIRELKKGGAVRYGGIDLWLDRGPDGEVVFCNSRSGPSGAIMLLADSILSNEWGYGEKAKKKITIRPGVFETNSSSSHSIVLATKEEEKGLRNGNLWFNVTYDWSPAEKRLTDPDTNLPLPAIVDEETAKRVWEFNSKLPEKKKNKWLGEELVNVVSSLGDVSFLGSSFPAIDDIRRKKVNEDGKVRLDISYYFG